MNKREIGEWVRSRREQKGLTQEELCDGICSVTTMSRMENGEQMLGRVKLDAIMQRLGQDVADYLSIFLNAGDYQIYKNRKKLSSLFYSHQYDEGIELIKILEKDNAFKKGLNLQFLMFYKLLVAQEEDITDTTNISDAEIVELLVNTIKISIPSYNESVIEKYCLSDIESLIINLKATTYFRMGESEKAIDILYKVKKSLENGFIDTEHSERAKTYAMILYNLSKYLGLSRKYDEAIEICEIGIRVCIKSNRSGQLPFLIFNKAYLLNVKGDKKSAERFLYQAYYGFESLENFKVAEKVKLHAMETFGIELKV